MTRAKPGPPGRGPGRPGARGARRCGARAGALVSAPERPCQPWEGGGGGECTWARAVRPDGPGSGSLHQAGPKRFLAPRLTRPGTGGPHAAAAHGGCLRIAGTSRARPSAADGVAQGGASVVPDGDAGALVRFCALLSPQRAAARTPPWSASLCVCAPEPETLRSGSGHAVGRASGQPL